MNNFNYILQEKNQKKKPMKILDFEEMTTAEVREGVVFLLRYLRLLITFIWFGAFLVNSVFCVILFPEIREKWGFVLVAVFVLFTPWFFLKDTNSLKKSLLISSLVSLLLSVPVLSSNWFYFISCMISLNTVAAFVCSFLKRKKVDKSEDRETLELKTEILFLIILFIFGINAFFTKY